jgi:hypothetical protein
MASISVSLRFQTEFVGFPVCIRLPFDFSATGPA